MLNRRNLILTTAAIALMPNFAWAESFEAQIQKNVRTLGDTNTLKAIKKVVIGSFVLQFQINSTDIKGGSIFNPNDTVSRVIWENTDGNMMSDIADAALLDLKAQFKAKGIEVIDESVLKGLKAYQDLIKGAGYGSGASGFGNADGTIRYISARSLQPIQSYAIEEGAFVTNYQSDQSIFKYIKDGPKNNPGSMRGNFWQGPGLEIEIAKALGVDAFVKVNYIINFARIDGKSKINLGGIADDGSEAASTVSTEISEIVRLRQDQSRIAFRLASSDKKMGYKVDLFKRKDFDPARDGDIVLNLTQAIHLGSNYFEFGKIEDKTKNVGLNPFAIIGRVKGEFVSEQTAKLVKPDEYSKRLTAAIKAMQSAMISSY